MKRIKVRPGKPQSALGFGVGCVFVLIGFFMVIPVFGAFGIVWTLVAVAITGVNAYYLFSEGAAASHEIIIEDGFLPPEGQPSADIEARLARLRELYDRRVITAEEYEEQRAKIIEKI